MATRYFRGDWTLVAQESRATPVAANSQPYTLTINGKTISITSDGSATAAEITAALTTAWNDSVDGEFEEVTATDMTTYVELLADTSGVPFAVSGSAGGGGSLTISTPTPANGPSFVDENDNWSGAAAPVGADTVYFQDLDVNAVYELDTYAAVAFTELNIPASYTGEVGLARWNEDGNYVEYRQIYFQNQAGIIVVGTGEGDGSGRIYLDSVATNNVVITVWKTASAADSELGALLWTGTGTGVEFNAVGGSVGLAMLPGEIATITTLNITDATVVHRAGTITTVNCLGNGSFTTDGSSIIVLLVAAGTGTTTIRGAGGAEQISMAAGRVSYESPANIAAIEVGDGAVLDFENLTSPITITSCTLHTGGEINDPNGLVTFTNGIEFTGRLGSGTSTKFNLGVGRTLTPS